MISDESSLHRLASKTGNVRLPTVARAESRYMSHGHCRLDTKSVITQRQKSTQTTTALCT